MAERVETEASRAQTQPLRIHRTRRRRPAATAQPAATVELATWRMRMGATVARAETVGVARQLLEPRLRQGTRLQTRQPQAATAAVAAVPEPRVPAAHRAPAARAGPAESRHQRPARLELFPVRRLIPLALRSEAMAERDETRAAPAVPGAPRLQRHLQHPWIALQRRPRMTRVGTEVRAPSARPAVRAEQGRSIMRLLAAHPAA